MEGVKNIGESKDNYEILEILGIGNFLKIMGCFFKN